MIQCGTCYCYQLLLTPREMLFFTLLVHRKIRLSTKEIIFMPVMLCQPHSDSVKMCI